MWKKIGRYGDGKKMADRAMEKIGRYGDGKKLADRAREKMAVRGKTGKDTHPSHWANTSSR